MKTIILALSFFLLYVNVIGQAFKLEGKEKSENMQFEDTKIDSTYTLYVKSICKKKSGKVAVPCNCSELGNYEPKDVIENEFIFISMQQKKAVVINYIKDRDQKFYNKTKAGRKALMNRTTELVDVNIWYFNQARFGNVDPTNSTITFFETTKPKDLHLWKIEIAGKKLQIQSVSIVRADGFDERKTDLSLALVPLFYKVDRFRIIFQEPTKDSMRAAAVFELPENRIAVDTKGGCVYFFFNQPEMNERNVVRFKSNRLYSYYRPIYN